MLDQLLGSVPANFGILSHEHDEGHIEQLQGR